MLLKTIQFKNICRVCMEKYLNQITETVHYNGYADSQVVIQCSKSMHEKYSTVKDVDNLLEGNLDV